MGSVSFLLFLLILISASTFLIFNSNQLIAGQAKAEVQSSMSMLTRFRLLLGLERKHGGTNAYKFHTYSPASAPSPAPVFHAHIYSRSPLPRQSLHPPVHNTEDDQGDRHNSRLHRIIIAAVVSLGVTLVITAAAILLLVKKFRRKSRSSSSVRKVSYDPGPELFYLSNLAPMVELDSNLKLSSEFKNVFTNQTMSSSESRSHDGEHDEELVKSEPGSVSSSDEEIILHNESLRSDDESFHSVCNSHSSVGLESIVSDENLGRHSATCSPFNSSYRSISPDYRLSQFSPIRPPCPHLQVLEKKTFQNPSLDRIEDNSDTGQSSQLEMVSLPILSPNASSEAPDLIVISPPEPLNQGPPSIPKENNSESAMPSSLPNESNTLPAPQPSKSVVSSDVSKPPPPPLPPVTSNGNIPKPPPPPLPPVTSNGNIPKPPPHPLPPSKPPSFRKGANPGNPPPPPPGLLQQSVPVGKDGTPLPKLKPLHWDKVRAAPDRSMVWDKIRSSSFELDEQMIESLFGYNLQNSAKNEESKNKTISPGKHVLDNKRLQNITILLKALNASIEQVREALMRGRGLSAQQLEALAKMAPTKEEEEKLSHYEGDIDELGYAERFVKAILNIPFAFSRIEVMLYKETFEDEVAHLKKSFDMLEEACKELRSSRLFLRLLEAVLKTGNRMNVGTIRGGARAFKLDTLLKLADVKGTDGKTTLLHFVVQEMIRSEGVSAMEKATQKAMHNKEQPKTADETEEEYRMVGLDLVSGLSNELCNVKKTASIDLEVLANSVANLSKGKDQLRHLIEVGLPEGETSMSFVFTMKLFLNHAEKIIKELNNGEGTVLVHVREITEYYHGDVSKDEKNPLRIFVIVRDFLSTLDRVCKEIRRLKSHQGPNPAIPFR